MSADATNKRTNDCIPSSCDSQQQQQRCPFALTERPPRRAVSSAPPDGREARRRRCGAEVDGAPPSPIWGSRRWVAADGGHKCSGANDGAGVDSTEICRVGRPPVPHLRRPGSCRSLVDSPPKEPPMQPPYTLRLQHQYPSPPAQRRPRPERPSIVRGKGAPSSCGSAPQPQQRLPCSWLPVTPSAREALLRAVDPWTGALTNAAEPAAEARAGGAEGAVDSAAQDSPTSIASGDAVPAAHGQSENEDGDGGGSSGGGSSSGGSSPLSIQSEPECFHRGDEGAGAPLPPPLAPHEAAGEGEGRALRCLPRDAPLDAPLGLDSPAAQSTRSGSSNSSASASVRELVKAANVAVAVVRLQRLLPHVSISEYMEARQLPLEGAGAVLARITRFVLRVRGFLLRRRLAKQRAAVVSVAAAAGTPGGERARAAVAGPARRHETFLNAWQAFEGCGVQPQLQQEGEQHEEHEEEVVKKQQHELWCCAQAEPVLESFTFADVRSVRISFTTCSSSSSSSSEGIRPATGVEHGPTNNAHLPPPEASAAEAQDVLVLRSLAFTERFVQLRLTFAALAPTECDAIVIAPLRAVGPVVPATTEEAGMLSCSLSLALQDCHCNRQSPLSLERLVEGQGSTAKVALADLLGLLARNRRGGVLEVVFDSPLDAARVLAAVARHTTRRLAQMTRFVSANAKRQLTIIHFNDVYHLDPHKGDGSAQQGTLLTGGASRFLTKVREIQERANPLILFSGDWMSPSLASVVLLGRQMVDAFNLIGVHCGTFGNHEFDYGLEALHSAVHGSTHGNVIFAGSNATWVMSNMTDASTGKPLGGAARRALFTWGNVRVGILGLSENWLPSCAQIPKGAALYADVFATGERLARELRSDGAEIVIALTHSRLSTDRQMAELCPSIDLILGGHDHFFRNQPSHRLVKSGEEFRYLTEITVTVAAADAAETSAPSATDVAGPRRRRRLPYTVDVHPITRGIAPHRAMETLIQRYEARLHAKMGKVIAVTPQALDSTEATCRFREGLLSGFVADVMAKRTNADFAVLGGAAIAGKGVLPPGDVTIGDVFNWFPSDTRCMVVALSGAAVMKLLNVMVADVPCEAPSFPHPSAALTFTINATRSPTQVEHVRVRGEPIDVLEVYSVAVEDFVGLGKGAYRFIPREGEVLTEEESAEQLAFWIVDYFESSMRNADERRCANMKKLRSAVRKKVATARAMDSPAVATTSQRGAKEAECPPVLLGGCGEECEAANASAALLDAAQTKRQRAMYQAQEELQALLQADPYEVNLVVACASRSLERLLHCSHVRIIHRDYATNTYWCRARWGGGGRLTTRNPEGFLERALEVRRPFFCSEVSSELLLDQVLELDPREETNSIICFPLLRPQRDSPHGDGRGDVLAVVQGVNTLAGGGNGGTGGGGGGFSDLDIAVGSAYCAVLAVMFDAMRLRAIGEVAEIRHRLMVEAASALVTPVTHFGARASAHTTLIAKIYEIVKHAKQLFHVKKAFFFIHDEAADEVWTAKRKDESDVIIRLPVCEAKIVGDVVACKRLIRVDAEISKLSLSRSDFTNDADASSLCVPVFSPEGPRGKHILGAVLLSSKLNGANFSPVDEAIALSFAPFAGITISNCIEMDSLRTGVKRDELPSFPVHTLGRIRFKCGWRAVRLRLPFIISPEFRLLLARSRPQQRVPDEDWTAVESDGEAQSGQPRGIGAGEREIAELLSLSSPQPSSPRK